MKKTATPRTALAAGVAKVLRRLHYPLDVMSLCVRWRVAYRIYSSLPSYCDTTMLPPAA